jgi:hypothetical protein
MALDLCDYSYAEAGPDFPIGARVADEWAIITERSTPTPDRFVRQMAVFLRNEDGSWRRDDERHENVLVDTGLLPGLLADHGVRATVETSFGAGVRLMDGLHAIIGSKRHLIPLYGSEASTRSIASTDRSTSASVVVQLDTEIRISRRPCQVVPPIQQVPSRWMPSITRSVR